MHRNISRAYDAIWAEHERIRRIRMRILSQGDPKLERRLLRANPDSKQSTHDEVLLYEERLSRPQRRRVLKLISYGAKIERVMETLLKL